MTELLRVEGLEVGFPTDRGLARVPDRVNLDLKAGQIPGLVDPPAGCRFHPRCPDAGPACTAGRPDPQMPAAGQMLRCHDPMRREGAA